MTEPLPKGKRPLSDKMAAALAWLVTGNAEKASTLCGVPARTIRDWMATPAWEVLMAEAKRKKQTELDAKFTSIIHLAVDATLDRLEYGDEVIAKDGTVARRRVSAREAALVAAMISDKRALLRGEATSRSQRLASKSLSDVKAELESAGRELPDPDLAVDAEKMN